MTTFFRHLRIGHRLVLCFSLILLLMIAGAWLAVSSSRHSRESLLQLVHSADARRADIRSMRTMLEGEDRIAQRLALVTSIDDARSGMDEVFRDIAAYRAAAQRFDASAESIEEMK